MASVLKTAAVIAALTFSATAALADGRAPTAEEQAGVEGALKSQGFTSWGKIEFDDGKWEIDNAVHTDGKRYDVDLSKADFSQLKKELDD